MRKPFGPRGLEQEVTECEGARDGKEREREEKKREEVEYMSELPHAFYSLIYEYVCKKESSDFSSLLHSA